MNPPRDKYRVIVCRGPECGDRRESAKVHAAFVDALRGRRWESSVELGWQSCFGRCRQGPNVLVRLAPKKDDRFMFALAPTASSNAALYNGVTPADVGRILDQHVAMGRILRDLIKRPEYGTEGVGQTLRSQELPAGQEAVPDKGRGGGSGESG